MDPKDHVLTINISRKTLMNVVVLALIVLALFALKTLVFVVLTSIVLASFIRTAAMFVKKRLGLARVISVVLMYLITFLVFALLFYLFIPVFLVELSNLLPVLAEHLPKGLPFISNLDLNALGQSSGDLSSSIKTVINAISGGVGNTLSVFFGSLANVVLVAVISFYLSVSKDGVESFLRILSPIQKEEYVINLWKRSQRKIAYWMQGQMMLGVMVGALTFLGLALLRVPHAPLLAIVAALFELIPFGIFLAAVPAVSLAFTGGGLTLALMVVALYIIVQQLEGYLLAPLVVHKVTGVSPLVVILSVVIGLELAGFWGLILGVPVAVTLLEYINDLEKERLLQMKNE